MTIEHFLEKKLQKFSILDLSLVKSVYFVFGLLICSLYPKLLFLSGWFYLALTVLCSMPLWLHLSSQNGGVLVKMKSYIKTNNPSNQVLLFLSVFFFSFIIGGLLPSLANIYWWAYLLMMIGLAIKPIQTTWFW